MAHPNDRNSLRSTHRSGMNSWSEMWGWDVGTRKLFEFKPSIRSIITITLPIVAAIVAISPAGWCNQASGQFGGRVIRHIRIIRRNVFTDEEQKGLLADDAWMDRFPLGAEIRYLNGPDKMDIVGWANWIHIKTRESVIEDELLFHPGDPDDLRLWPRPNAICALGILRDAHVSSTTATDDPAAADVDVITEDAWTLQPKVSLSFLGGNHVTGGAGIAEYNLFGFDKAADSS